MRYLPALIMAVVFHCRLHAQDSIRTYDPAKGRAVGITLGAAYAGSMTGLYKLWYEDHPSSSFHFFDDSHEWKWMDKMGHVGSAYYLSRWNSKLIRWTGIPQRKSAWMGTGISYLYLTTIEVFDAFSETWGFSVSDALANTAGGIIYIGQELAWKEQRIQVKFSYQPTDFANFRPDALGENHLERIFKDYNGQTYWLSANIYSFTRGAKFPRWLNIAFGYGANGMVTAYEQVFEINKVIFPQDQRIRQYYLSADVDLNRIPWKSKFMRTVSEIIGFIKIPLPAIRWDERQKPELMLFGF